MHHGYQLTHDQVMTQQRGKEDGIYIMSCLLWLNTKQAFIHFLFSQWTYSEEEERVSVSVYREEERDEEEAEITEYEGKWQK